MSSCRLCFFSCLHVSTEAVWVADQEERVGNVWRTGGLNQHAWRHARVEPRGVPLVVLQNLNEQHT